MPIKIVSYKSFGKLFFGQSTVADALVEYGDPEKKTEDRLEGIEYIYSEFIARFDAVSGLFKEATLLPYSNAIVNGIEVTWDRKFLSAMCHGHGVVYDVYGFIVIPGMGIAVTGIHDDDSSQLAITFFKTGGFDDLMYKGKVFDPEDI